MIAAIIGKDTAYHAYPGCDGIKGRKRGPVVISDVMAMDQGRTACPRCWVLQGYVVEQGQPIESIGSRWG